MTLPGIITMILSIGFVWILLSVCVYRLLHEPASSRTPKKDRQN